jgi:hypothetical protein
VSCTETAQGIIYVAASAMVINGLADPPSPKTLACNEVTLLAHITWVQRSGVIALDCMEVVMNMRRSKACVLTWQS